MTARTRQGFVLTDGERRALDAARAKFVQWKRDWYDGGMAVDEASLTELRKHARAFHVALERVLHANGQVGNPTLARLLGRMQAYSVPPSLAHCRDRLEVAYEAAVEVDMALAVGRGGARKDRLVYEWVACAADQWPGGKPTASGRFAAALLEYKHKCVPAVGSAERVAAALAVWNEHRNR